MRQRTTSLPAQFWGTLTLGYELTSGSFTTGNAHLDLGLNLFLTLPVTKGGSGELTVSISETEADQILWSRDNPVIIAKILDDTQQVVTFKDQNNEQADSLEIPIAFGCKPDTSSTLELTYFPLSKMYEKCC